MITLLSKQVSYKPYSHSRLLVQNTNQRHRNPIFIPNSELTELISCRTLEYWSTLTSLERSSVYAILIHSPENMPSLVPLFPSPSVSQCWILILMHKDSASQLNNSSSLWPGNHLDLHISTEVVTIPSRVSLFAQESHPFLASMEADTHPEPSPDILPFNMFRPYLNHTVSSCVFFKHSKVFYFQKKN